MSPQQPQRRKQAPSCRGEQRWLPVRSCGEAARRTRPRNPGQRPSLLGDPTGVPRGKPRASMQTIEEVNRAHARMGAVNLIHIDGTRPPGQGSQARAGMLYAWVWPCTDPGLQEQHLGMAHGAGRLHSPWNRAPREGVTRCTRASGRSLWCPAATMSSSYGDSREDIAGTGRNCYDSLTPRTGERV